MSFAARRGQVIAQIRKLALGGTASIAASVAATNVLRIVSSMTLTRLLDSRAYGVVGIITSIAYMLAMISDVGVMPFVVRHAEGDDPHFRDAIWTVRLIRGFALTGVMIVLAHPAAHFLGKEELAPVIMVWSCSFLIDGLSAISFATGVRDRQLWRLSILDIATNVVTLIGSVVAAILLRSYWAMIIGMVMGQVTRAILSYGMFPGSRRRFRVDRAQARELWEFSRYIAMSSMLTLVILQADKVVLARIMPLAQYGFYAIATTLAIAPEAVANPYTQRVLYPIYARIARDARSELSATFYGARRRVALLYAAGVGAMIGGAPLMVAILYDPRYQPVALFIQLLAIRVFLRMPNMAAFECVVALGHTRWTLIANIIRIVWLFAGGALGLWLGDVMLLVLVVATDELPAMLFYWGVLYRERVLNLVEESYGFLAGIAGAALGWAAAWVGLHFIH
jgi:lipopolysaccharide exporter